MDFEWSIDQWLKQMISPRSSCRCDDPIGLHKEIGRDFPTCVDLLDHLEGQGAAPSKDFGRTRPRAENVCKLSLTVAELFYGFNLKNPKFADHVIESAMRRRHKDFRLSEIDDAVEDAAHAAAMRQATRRSIIR